MAAAAVARSNFSDRINRLVESVAERIDTSTNGRLSAYLERSTALSSKPGIFNSNPKFGVIHAVETNVTRDWGKSVTDFALFTIEEARERLSALIDGDYFVDSFHDLIDYLKERSLALESRLLQGKMINYLVDQKTKQSVPAALVHSSLSYKNVKTMEMKAALRGLIGNNDPATAFASWQGMSMIMSGSKHGMSYTVSGNEAHFGRQFATATNDVQENLSIIRDARAQGIDLILPRHEGANPGELIQGMPILRKSKSMPAAEVHPGLDHRALSMAFGQGMVELFEEMARKHGDMANSAKSSLRDTARVVSMEEFKSRYAAPKIATPVEEEGFGFGGMSAPLSEKRDIGLRRGKDALNSLAVWDFDVNDEIMMVPQCLPEGEYKRVSHNGDLEGYTQIGSKGQMRHLDQRRKEIVEFQEDRKDNEQNMSSQSSYRLR
jgi:hypothetical protein